MSERRKRLVNPDDQIAKELTPEDVGNALKIIKHLAGNGTVEIEEAAELIVRIEEGAKKIGFQSTRLQKQEEERRISRRQFFSEVKKWVKVSAGAALVSKAGFFLFDETIGPTAVAKRALELQNRSKHLEDNYTLNLEPSASSYSGWTVKYTKKDQVFIPTSLVSDPLTPGTNIKFPATKLNKLEDTGIVINNHIRTTDSQPIGKLSIITQYTPSTRSSYEKVVIGEEWVLRDQSTEDINPTILAFENKSTGSTIYLSITRSRSIENPTFQLQNYTLKQ